MSYRYFLAGLTMLIGATAGTAQAPLQRPIAGPTVSPYLNILRGGNTPAFNYYSLVRPQLETNANIQALQGRLNPIQLLSTPPNSGDDTLTTGHATAFLNYGGYFQNTAPLSNRSRTQVAPVQPRTTTRGRP
jgi:hypothetical protein